jgi:hypothetical protein
MPQLRLRVPQRHPESLTEWKQIDAIKWWKRRGRDLRSPLRQVPSNLPPLYRLLVQPTSLQTQTNTPSRRARSPTLARSLGELRSGLAWRRMDADGVPYFRLRVPLVVLQARCRGEGVCGGGEA